MEREHRGENFHLSLDASRLIQPSTNRVFRVNGKQPQLRTLITQT